MNKPLSEVDELRDRIQKLEDMNLLLKKQMDFKMSTFCLVKKSAIKHANSIRPKEIDIHKWIASKERRIAYNAFVIGAKCENQYMKIENDKLKKQIEEMREALEFYANSWEQGRGLNGELLVRKALSYDAFEEVHTRARAVLQKLGGEK